MTKPNALGILAIILFLSAFIIPVFLIFYNNLHKQLGIYYLILLLILKLAFIGVFINSYLKCRNSKCENHNIYLFDKKTTKVDVIKDIVIKDLYNEDLAVYNLFTYGGWTNFQIWFASVSQNVWKDLLFTLILFLIPFPIVPSSPSERFYIMLSKLGLYKLFLIIALGNPIYIVHDGNQYNESNTEEKVEIVFSVVLILLFVFLISYELIIQKQIFKTFFK